MSNKKRAVVLGLSPTGLSVARSLAPHGVEVYGVDVLWYEVGHYSRSVLHDRRISHLPPGPELLAGLVAFGKESSAKPVIFNANDQYIDFIAQNHKVLEPWFSLTESMRPESNTVFLNKRTLYQACQSLGVGLPQTFFPEKEDDLVKAAQVLRYPAIVKPTLAFKLRKLLHGKKLIEVVNAGDLLAWWRRFHSWGVEVVVQECIIGPEQNIAVAGLYMDKAGQCRSLFTAKKYRQYPPMYGSGSYLEAKWIPEIADLSIALARELKYHGVCGTEFKWDTRDRQWKLIEINCRPTLWFALTRAAGVDVVWDAYCDLVGQSNPVNIGRQNDRMRWQLLVRDLVSSFHFLRQGALSWSEFGRTTLDQRRKEWAVCAWDDWGANWGYLVNTFMHVWVNFIRPPKQ